MSGGHRYRVHNGLRDAIYRIAGTALLAPQLEPHAFTQGRPDILFRVGEGRTRVTVCADVSVVSPLAVSAIRAAAHSPGGASELAAVAKHHRYDASAAEAGTSIVPLIFDCFGAWNKEGLAFIHKLAAAWGRRFEISPRRSSDVVFSYLNSVAMKGIARALLICAPRENTVVPEQSHPLGQLSAPGVPQLPTSTTPLSPVPVTVMLA